MNNRKKIEHFVKKHSKTIKNNPSRKEMIKTAVHNDEALVSESGALATWTPPESTGRSPKDTVIVKRKASSKFIDWSSPNNLPIDENTFNLLVDDALDYLKAEKKLFQTDRVIGADASYALPVRTITTHALAALFTDNMFRPVPKHIDKSIYSDKPFYLLHIPYKKLKSKKYKGLLRKLSNEEIDKKVHTDDDIHSETTNMAVATDFDNRIGIIIGSAYMGSMKKMLFTAMNFLLPFDKVLPLHCSANEGKFGDSALLLGLSGTGKTTLSADPKRKLLGDDEHGWSAKGIANFENGCYAKMIDITAQSEPDIYDAVMHKDKYTNHGSIVENAMIFPNRKFDFFDTRLTPNSRASYLLKYLKNIKKSSKSGHPSTILFLTADAYGVLPPISKLNPDQAMLWFLMGYTSKLAGTETGVTEPQATFSRFFGQPFMPLNPDIYADMLGKKMKKHNTDVFLINTGWTGGSYGVGKRMKLAYTRKMVDAALEGILKNVKYVENKLFHVSIPKEVPGVPSSILFPKMTWADPKAYDKTAKKLAKEFAVAFDKNYGNKHIKPEVIKQCPGK